MAAVPPVKAAIGKGNKNHSENGGYECIVHPFLHVATEHRIRLRQRPPVLLIETQFLEVPSGYDRSKFNDGVSLCHGDLDRLHFANRLVDQPGMPGFVVE
ncbi:MAG: hypothetical protein BWY82_02295 [Verrucomicrobia bacterium ADurb.Bin474]|nr:MAG: hypothetical protein BWY82_02295 [Verrucomicrobia bacterium ADurb.Bin474]